MGGEDRGVDPERQCKEGFSSLAPYYSHWEDFKNIHAQVHVKILIQGVWGDAQDKILSESSPDDCMVQPELGQLI